MLREAGRPVEAIDLYRGVAEAYAEDGRLVQAMAVCKGILDIDPEHRDTLEMLAALATRKQQRPPTAIVSQVGGRWVAEPTGERLYAPRRGGHARRQRRGRRRRSRRQQMFAAAERTPAESEILTPAGGDDERTPIGDPEPDAGAAGRSGGAAQLARALAARGADGPRARRSRRRARASAIRSRRAPAHVEAQARKQWSHAPRVATPMAERRAALDEPLDFPDETKRAARGHRLLDLPPPDDAGARRRGRRRSHLDARSRRCASTPIACRR